ncbi:MAG: DMT family transporter [Desulfohalobiaceae bacterium]|nr:DMT family transporter [Desulfohalobiaceae bacterium]
MSKQLILKDPAAALYLGLGATLISFSSVFVKVAECGPITAGFYRVLFGGGFLLAMLILRGATASISRRGLGLSFVCGLVFALNLTLWHKSIHSVGPGLATVLSNFQVLVLAGIGVLFFHEKTNLRFAAAVGLALGGLFLLVGPGWNSVGTNWRMGVVYGLCAAVAYALYILSVRLLQTKQSLDSVVANMALLSLVTAVIMAGEIIVAGESFRIPGIKTFLALAGYGFISQMVGWILISFSLPRINVSLAGLLILLQPALSFAWDILFFQRPTTILDFAGAGLALYGIYLGLTRHS